MLKSIPWKKGLERASTILVAAYLLVAVGVFIAIPILAYQWLGHPFLGILVENTLVVNSSGPSRSETWEAYNLGLQFGDQIKAIDGTDVRDIHHLNEILNRSRPGFNITLSILTKEGEEQIYYITLEKFSSLDVLSYLILPYLLGLTSLGVGIWVYTIRRRDATGKAFAVFSYPQNGIGKNEVVKASS